MKFSLNWLRDFVEVEDGGAVPAMLTKAGIEVESVTHLGGDIRGVLTAHVLAADPHPKSDHLTICRVHDGAVERTVICGAPNVRTGQKVALAVPGSTIPNLRIELKTIRGVESFGMIASKAELGISAEHSGIWVLPDNTPVGRELTSVFPIVDTVFEADITANRPDLLCVIGIAREIAAATGRKVKRPHVDFEPVGGEIDNRMKVEIAATDLCLRYAGIIVSGLTVAPSPVWMQLRLEAVGVRSLSNLVDITNYVLQECGQPLHAFDDNFLEGHRIVVRRSRGREVIRTLDGQDRTLTGEELLICDAAKPVALAGVMGGENSLVTDATREVFIESAFFLPTNIRRTSKRLGLSSDSSYRFERGIDIDGVPYGLHRAARLMAELGGGKVLPGCIDEYPAPKANPVIALRPSRVNWVLGTNLDAENISGLLNSIELKTESRDSDGLAVTVPNFRVDIEREIDLIEEVARRYGYDNIASTIPATAVGSVEVSLEARAVEIVREIMVGQGFAEFIGVSMMNPAALDRFKVTSGSYISIRNPMSAEMSVMQDSLLPGLCLAAARNFARQVADLAFFEVRRVYLPSGRELPDEPTHVSAILTGNRFPNLWSHEKRKADFFDLKGSMEMMFQALGIAGRIEFKPDDDVYYLARGAAAKILLDGKPAGTIGAVAPKVLKTFEIEDSLYAFEFDLTALLPALKLTREYKSWPRYPGTSRDLAALLPVTQPVGPILAALRALHSEIRNVRAFDVYTGKGIPEGKKSVAFSVELQAFDRTLTDAEIDAIIRDAIEMLSRDFAASLRG